VGEVDIEICSSVYTDSGEEVQTGVSFSRLIEYGAFLSLAATVKCVDSVIYYVNVTFLKTSLIQTVVKT